MSHELGALLRQAVPLADVLEHLQTTLTRLTIASSYEVRVPGGDRISDLTIGPFALPSTRVRSFVLWERSSVDISVGPDSSVGLLVGHMLSDDERGLSSSVLTDKERDERSERAGFRAIVEIGRTPQSFLLGTLLACSIASLNGTRVLDDEDLLHMQRELLDPAVILETLSRLDAFGSFESFATRFYEQTRAAADPRTI
jgi:hypothetical protein